MQNKIIKYGGALVLVLLFILVFGYYCPIERITGFPCPGCNMTTSLYWLIKGDISLSMYYHAMLIPTIVAALLGIYFTYKENQKLRNILLVIWTTMVIVYYIYRMITVFPDAPMVYQMNSLFGKIISMF